MRLTMHFKTAMTALAAVLPLSMALPTARVDGPAALDGRAPDKNFQSIFGPETVFKGLKRTNGETYDGTSKSVRIPALGVTNNNVILAVTDARVDDAGDLGMGSNNIQIALSRSTDGGDLWSHPAIIAATGKEGQGLGDASVLVDRTSNTVFLFYNRSPAAGISFNSNGKGSNAADDDSVLHVTYMSSTDDGQTWSDPVELNPSVRDETWQNQFVSSGHGTQLSTGRLLQPIVFRDGQGVTHAANLYSDDGGQTWRRGDAAGEHVNENKAVERSDGRVVQNLRHNSESFRYYATSTDGGVTFAPMTRSTLIDPMVNADELSYLRPKDRSQGRPTRTAQALFSNPKSSSGRQDLTIRWTEDNARSFSEGVLLQRGGSGYSTTAMLDDYTICDLYEANDSGEILFARFNLDWVKQ
ncbi:hypothetical protein ACO1O0_002306 [Amphichorda felina]